MPERLVDLGNRTAQSFENAIFTFTHRLGESDLFSEEGLLELVDTQPREFCNVSQPGTDPNVYEWNEGDTTGLNAEQLLEAVRRGRFWLNVRQIERFQPKWRALIDELYDELEQQAPGFRAGHRKGNVLISSPGALVYYHVDVPQNMLWHVRGTKRVWAYGDHQQLLSPERLEAVIACDDSEDVPYDPSYDDRATVYDLQPGQAVTWPQNTPHRVTNLEGLNVSLSTEHLTPAARRFVRVNRANRFLRKHLGLNCRATATRGPGYALKSLAYLAGRAVQRTVSRRDGDFDYPCTFRVDLDAPGCCVPLVGREPQRAASEEAAELVAS